MYKLLAFLCLFFHHTHANDITFCAADIYESCKLNEYFMSTLEIVDRELVMNRGKVNDYFTRQICNNAFDEMINFKKCVVNRLGHHCWKWTGVFDSIRMLRGDKHAEMELEAKRYEQTFVILEYNLCSDNEMRAEYFDIRSCSHKKFQMIGLQFHERFSQCMANSEPNAIQKAMDNMDLCRGNNHEYSCFVDSLLGEHCEKVRDALLRYSDIHAGHAGLHPDELNRLEFILQAAYSDHLRLPKHNECHLLIRSREGEIPTKIYYAIIVLSFMFIGALCFYFRNDLLALMRNFFH